MSSTFTRKLIAIALALGLFTLGVDTLHPAFARGAAAVSGAGYAQRADDDAARRCEQQLRRHDGGSDRSARHDNASDDGHDNASDDGHDNARDDGHDNARDDGHDNARDDGHGDERDDDGHDALDRGGHGSRSQIGVQLLAINDFHGALESRFSTIDNQRRLVGGASVLAAYLDQAEREATAEGARTFRVAAGDLIGASPPISALLQDEPTIRALDLMGFRYSSVGNHEFDEGLAELRRLQEGGFNPATGCFEGPRQLQYLAANVVDARTDRPVFPPYAVETVDGVPIGFIGVVLEETPTIVVPAGVAGLRFLDEAETVNRYVRELLRRGVKAIVVLIHQGGSGSTDGTAPITGSIVPIVQNMSDHVDVVVSGHTHQGYRGMIGSKLVTQAFSNGTAFADIDLVLGRRSRDVDSKSAQIVTAFADAGPGTNPNADVNRVVQAAREQVAPIVNRTIATAAATITRTQNPAGESALGNLIADAQRAKAGTQVAFMNPGGIREDIAAGPVSFGELFTVQPFGNDVVKLELTGAQIEQLLEQQFTQPDNRTRFLQVSGITYTYTNTPGDRVKAADILIGGRPLDVNATYTVAVNSFLAEGGDNFAVLREGRNRVVFGDDLQALIEYVQRLPQPFNAAIEGRIRTR